MKKFIVVLVVVMFGILLGLRLYQELSADSVAAGGGSFGGPRATMLVETAPVELRLFETNLEVVGELRPRASVEVTSKISGRLEQVLLERGDAVRQGQLLAVVDDVDLQQQIRRAEASMAVARAAVNREKATLENLELQVNRYRGLHAEALIATQDLEDLESRVRVAQAQYELTRAQVDQAEASLRELKIQQEQTRIYSPLNGFVGTRHLDPGALVNASTPILSVLNIERVKTVVPVAESALNRVQLGLPAAITVDAYPDSEYSGKITRISPFLNPATRSADVEIEIANPGLALKPGMFARVQINASITTEAFSVPRSALLTRGDIQGVFILSPDATTIFTPIEIGRIDGESVEILDGLEAGAEVVTSGAQKLNAGDQVRTQ